MGEIVSVSFKSFLLDLLEVASIKEAWQELEVRTKGKAREEVVARIASLCASLGVTSTDEMREEVDRKISTEITGFETGLYREEDRQACLGELLGIPSHRQFWERRLGLLGAERSNIYESKEEAMSEYSYICPGLILDKDIWEEVDRRISAQKAAIKDEALKEEAFSQDRSKDDTLSPTTSLENANPTATTQ